MKADTDPSDVGSCRLSPSPANLRVAFCASKAVRRWHFDPLTWKLDENASVHIWKVSCLVSLHTSAVLEARGVLGDGHGSCNAYVKVCTAATAHSCEAMQNICAFTFPPILRLASSPMAIPGTGRRPVWSPAATTPSSFKPSPCERSIKVDQIDPNARLG